MKVRVYIWFSLYNVIVLIVMEACSDPNAIRLTQYASDTIGQLEMCSGGIWGSVCRNGVTENIAAVACRELGHSAYGKVYDYVHFIVSFFLQDIGFFHLSLIDKILFQ